MGIRNNIRLSFLALVVLACCGLGSSTSFVNIAGLHVGELTIFRRTHRAVTRMEVDEFIPRNILFAHEACLETTNGDSAHKIFGYCDGSYGRAPIIEFFQRNRTSIYLIVSDTLVMIDRLRNTSTVISPKKYTSMLRPLAASADILASNSTSIFLFNLDTRSERIIFNVPSTYIRNDESIYDMSYNYDNTEIIITSKYRIFQLRLDDNSFSVIAGSDKSGLRDGLFSESMYNEVYGPTVLSSNVFAVGDRYNYKIRLLDQATRTVYSLCSRGSVTAGDAFSCRLDLPQSLLYDAPYLYIGQDSYISRIVIDLGSCHTNDCQNGGSCYQAVNGYKCICQSLWTGEKCEKKVNTCQATTCSARGRCYEVAGGSTMCVCDPGYTSVNCGQEINLCASYPCSNFGTCRPGINSFTCSCKPGYTGRTCGEAIKTCTNYTCNGRGRCLDVFGGSAVCLCDAGYTGPFCGQEIDICHLNPCLNSGTCKKTQDTFSCSCSANWTGKTCETEIETCPQSIIAVGDDSSKEAKLNLFNLQITLPVGSYMFRKNITQGVTCDGLIRVLDSRSKERIDIKANYRVSCSILSDFKAIILSAAKGRYHQIEAITNGACLQTDAYDIQLSCRENVTTILWPTSCVYPSFSSQIDSITAVIKENLKKARSDLLEIFVLSQFPPFVLPIANNEGMPASLSMSPLCGGGNQTSPHC